MILWFKIARELDYSNPVDKAHVRGHYRTNPKTKESYYVPDYYDKRKLKEQKPFVVKSKKRVNASEQELSDKKRRLEEELALHEINEQEALASHGSKYKGDKLHGKDFYAGHSLDDVLQNVNIQKQKVLNQIKQIEEDLKVVKIKKTHKEKIPHSKGVSDSEIDRELKTFKFSFQEPDGSEKQAGWAKDIQRKFEKDSREYVENRRASGFVEFSNFMKLLVLHSFDHAANVVCGNSAERWIQFKDYDWFSGAIAPPIAKYLGNKFSAYTGDDFNGEGALNAEFARFNTMYNASQYYMRETSGFKRPRPTAEHKEKMKSAYDRLSQIKDKDFWINSQHINIEDVFKNIIKAIGN